MDGAKTAVFQGKTMVEDRQRLTIRKYWVLLIYVFAYSALFLPFAQSAFPVLLTLLVTSVVLWSGVLSFFTDPGSREWYDPSVLFGLSVFYYSFKGLTLGYGVHESYLNTVPDESLPGLYLQASLYVIAGFLTWNWFYRWAAFKTDSGTVLQRQAQPLNLEAIFIRNVMKLVVFFSGVGVVSFLLLFHSIGMSPTAFLENPILRSFLTDGTLGVASPLANLWISGAFMFPLASCIWLAGAGAKGRQPHPIWFMHLLVSIIIYLLIAGRVNLLGFFATLIIIYALTVRKVPVNVLVLGGFAGMLYAYIIHIWRSVMGTQKIDIVRAGQVEIAGRASFGGFLEFITGVDLSDIRIFPLIIDTYGVSRPFHWGDTLLGIIYGFIPRTIWPGKPLDLGLEIGSLSDVSRVVLTGTPPGFFPEMFMNLHVVGILVGAALLGWGFGTLYRRLVLRGRDAVSSILYALVAPAALTLPSGTFANVVTSILVPSVAFLVCLKLVKPFSGKQTGYTTAMRLDR
jgi:hypothetical protein